MRNEEVEKLKIEALKKLTIDEKIEILGSMMDTIMEKKIELVKQQYGIEDDEEAIRILREKLIKLHKEGR